MNESVVMRFRFPCDLSKKNGQVVASCGVMAVAAAAKTADEARGKLAQALARLLESGAAEGNLEQILSGAAEAELEWGRTHEEALTDRDYVEVGVGLSPMRRAG